MFRNKKEEKLREKELFETGLYLNEITDGNTDRRGILCFIRGILVFLACYSTIGAVVSSFGLEFEVLYVAAAMLVLAMLAAYVYYNKVTFYLGYAFLFFILIVLAFAFYMYINSGFQALLNEMRDAYTAFFDLPAGRMSEEMIPDRLKTVSYMMVFVAAVFSIFFNITISGYMDLPTTFLVSFVPLMIPFYIDKIPKKGYLVMLLSVYTSVLLLSRSGRFTLPYRYKKDMPYGKKKEKKKNSFFYMASVGGMLYMVFAALILSIVFMFVSGTVFNDRFSTKNVSNPVKDLSDKYVKMIVTGGISSLLNRYDARGGLSKGKIGGIRSVNPDFETDLMVWYDPADIDYMYLAGYRGVYYSNNEFKSELPEEDIDPIYTEAFMTDPLPPEVMEAYKEIMDADLVAHGEEAENTYSALYGNRRFMSVRNVDADESVIFEPYYTTGVSIESSGTDMSRYTVGYYPYDPHPEQPDMDIMKPYTDYANEYYRTYPESLTETLKNTCENAGIVTGGDTLENAARLRQYFINEFRYTMTPGAVPYGEDAIDYFLTRQHRGFCVHFASSAALILRYAGIPTRYVEGYVMSENDITKRLSDDRVLANITDASAHAWVEIYITGYGWLPYEFTPPAEEEVSSDVNLPFFLNGLITETDRNGGTQGGTDDALDNVGRGKKGRTSISYIYLPFVWTLCFLLIFVVLSRVIGAAVFIAKKLYYEKKGDYEKALNLQNDLLIKTIKKKAKIKTKAFFIRDEEELLSACAVAFPDKINKKDIRYLCDIVYSAFYSGEKMNESSYVKAKKIVGKCIVLLLKYRRKISTIVRSQ